MLHYIIQIIAFQVLFLTLYDLFFRKETFFNWNRAYLLVSALLSVGLPFIKIAPLKTAVPQQFVVLLPEVVIGDVAQQSNDPLTVQEQMIGQTEALNWSWDWSFLLYVGICIAVFIFLFKILKLVRLFQNNPKRWRGDVLIVNLLKSSAAFSVFHYIFLGEQIKREEKEIILKHELVHVTDRHTLDLLVFEVFRIVFWFNPLVYIYQNRITELHEFVADAKTVKQHNKTDYYQNLLSQVFETQDLSFINTFFKQSLIKKRILMLSKSKSKQIYLVKYALLVPVVFGMLLYTSSYAQETSNTQSTLSQSLNQELTDEALEQKYYDEILKNDSEGVAFIEIYEKFMPRSDKYIKSREAYFKMRAFFRYLFFKKDGASKDGKAVNTEFEKLSKKYKTYQEYLEYKKTDEAKKQWESNFNRDGVLRLVVDDFKNMTDAEQKRYDKKLKMIENDDYFHSLLMTDGKTVTTLQFDSINSKKIPQPSNNNPQDALVEVPYAVVEEVPLFEGCDVSLTKEEKKECTSMAVAKYVNANFNMQIAKQLGLEGRQRITVIFKIGKDGRVYGVRARAKHPKLEEEIKRVINSMPVFTPGKQKGKAVVVPYSLPVVFQVQG